MFNFKYLPYGNKPLKTALLILISGLLVTACGDRSNDLAKTTSNSELTVPCVNTSGALSIFAPVLDAEIKSGWHFAGQSFPGQKKNVPMGRFDNQIIMELPVPAGKTAVKINLPVSGTVANAAIILDTVWYSGDKEVGRAAPNIGLGSNLSSVITTSQQVPSGADRLTLIARPWREIDGIITLAAGELFWCAK